MRSQTGASLPLGFTGELTDPTTGFLDLRARNYDSDLGRFLSRDTVSPNAPGSQGYNPYAYVANNPTTWTDPSGHLTLAWAEAIRLLQAAFRIGEYRTPIIGGSTLVAEGGPLQKIGGGVELLLTAVACAVATPCRSLADFLGSAIITYGSAAAVGAWNGTIDQLRTAAETYPQTHGATNLPDALLQPILLQPGTAVPGSAGRIYAPTTKHDPVYSRNPKATPMDLDDATAQQVLNEGYQQGKTVWGYHNGKIYRFFPEGGNKYHGFPYPGSEAPVDYLRQLRADGTISSAEYNRLRRQAKVK